jgi:gamma-polyglutamate biosynthesis protein CapA
MPYHNETGIAGKHFEHGSEWLIKSLSGFFKDTDCSFANLESPLVKDHGFASENIFAGLSSFAEVIVKSGVNVVSVANNHILEQGEKGFNSTIESLKNNGIEAVGIYTDGTSNFVVKDIKGLKIGFAAFNAIHDIENPDLYANYSVDSVLEIIGSLKSQGADYIILSFHWGDEYIQMPSPMQVKEARQFIDFGADLIVGHHPHVIQPYEKYKNGYILYSLGNFMFDMIWSNKVRTGMLAEVHLNESFNAKIKFRPIYINDSYQPVPVKDISRFIAHLNQLNKKFSILASTDYWYDYNKQRSRARLMERVKMKIYLAKNWHNFSSSGKKELYRKFNKALSE